MSVKRAIVTGGSGFIGSWLVQELLSCEMEVWVVVRERSRLLQEFLDNERVQVIVWDLRSEYLPELEEKKFDFFYHLSWAGVSPNYKNEVKIQLDNIKMSIRAMELCRMLECKKFIAAGTVAEYVFVRDVMNVNARQTPNDMYGAAKVSTHYFLEVLSKQWSIPFIWTVIPSTFGERRSDSNILTYTICSLLKGETPRYGDLEQMWDFLYVSDVARALRLIGEKGKSGRTYGIGSGVYKPLKEYITTVRDLIAPEARLGIGENPALSNQTFSSCVNIYDLIRDTGFRPQVSFEEGIVRTVRYWRAKLDI